MPKIALYASAFALGVAVIASAGDPAMAAKTKNEDAGKRAECQREATLYIGELKAWWMKRCMAGKDQVKPAAVEPAVHAPGPAAMPRNVTPLGAGNPPSTSTGSAAPSTAPVAPSAPTVGSSGTSISGSGATSTSGSSNSSIGSSGGGSSSGGGR
jgi:uncharacterized membrane protein YgcG